MHFCVILICTIPSAEGEDYTVTPPGVYEATFPSVTTMNGDTACDTITIIDDSDLEGSHDVGFSIRRATVGGTSLPGIQFIGQFTSVEIEDNDGRKSNLLRYFLYFLVIVICKNKRTTTTTIKHTTILLKDVSSSLNNSNAQ